jgi:hypothetical protein
VQLGDLAFSSLVVPLRIHAGLEHVIEGTRALLRRRVARDHGVLGAPARATGGECPGGPLLDGAHPALARHTRVRDLRRAPGRAAARPPETVGAPTAGPAGPGNDAAAHHRRRPLIVGTAGLRTIV